MPIEFYWTTLDSSGAEFYEAINFVGRRKMKHGTWINFMFGNVIAQDL